MSKKKKSSNKNSFREHNPRRDVSSVDPVTTEAFTVFDLINKYGTYNIQPTADTDNSFPKIAQGLPDEKYRKDVQE